MKPCLPWGDWEWYHFCHFKPTVRRAEHHPCTCWRWNLQTLYDWRDVHLCSLYRVLRTAGAGAASRRSIRRTPRNVARQVTSLAGARRSGAQNALLRRNTRQTLCCQHAGWANALPSGLPPAVLLQASLPLRRAMTTSPNAVLGAALHFASVGDGAHTVMLRPRVGHSVCE